MEFQWRPPADLSVVDGVGLRCLSLGTVVIRRPNKFLRASNVFLGVDGFANLRDRPQSASGFGGEPGSRGKSADGG